MMEVTQVTYNTRHHGTLCKICTFYVMASSSSEDTTRAHCVKCTRCQELKFHFLETQRRKETKFFNWGWCSADINTTKQNKTAESSSFKRSDKAIKCGSLKGWISYYTSNEHLGLPGEFIWFITRGLGSLRRGRCRMGITHTWVRNLDEQRMRIHTREKTMRKNGTIQ